MVSAQYQALVASEDIETSPNNETYPCTNICYAVGIVFGGISIFSSWPLTAYALQGYANRAHHDITYSPQLIIFAAAIWFFLQTLLASTPFQFALKKPIIDRYVIEGLNATGFVILRKKEYDDSSKYPTYKIIFLYQPNSFALTLYAKNITVAKQDFEMQALDVVVLPEIPTSAVLKTQLDSAKGELSCTMITSSLFTVAAIFVMPSLNAKLNQILMYNYDASGFKSCLWMILAMSWVSSVCLGYAVVAKDVNDMLHGKSGPTSIPPSDLITSNEDLVEGDCSDEVEMV